MTASIPPEIWTMVGLHLKPRYVARLLSVSKTTNRAVDNENYWTRVAAHLTWRMCPLMELDANEQQDKDRLLPLVDPDLNLYDMMALDKGYLWSMNHFLERIDAMGDVHSQCGDAWRDISLKERTTLFFVDSELIFLEGDNGVSIGVNTQNNGAELTMKELVRRIVFVEKSTRRTTTTKLIQFVWEMEEDTTLTPQNKRNVIRKFRKLLFDMDSDPGYRLMSMCSPTVMMAKFFRRF